MTDLKDLRWCAWNRGEFTATLAFATEAELIAFLDVTQPGHRAVVLPDPPAELPAPSSLPDDEHTRAILGLMCFQLGGLAQALRRDGLFIERRAEAEQAAVMRWLLNLYLLHGEGWRTATDQFIQTQKRKAVASGVGA